MVNLEHGRRKSLRVHELLALLYVLDAPQPLGVIVPDAELGYPVVPMVTYPAEDVRAWLSGEGKSLRQKHAEEAPAAAMESAAQLYEQQGQAEMAAAVRKLAGLLHGDAKAESDDHGHGI